MNLDRAFVGLALLVGIAGSGCSSEDKPSSPNSPVRVDFPAAYVVNSGSATVSVIDLRTNSVVRTVELSGAAWPHHINMSHSGRMMAVSAPGMDLSSGHGGGMMGMMGRTVMMDAEACTLMTSVPLEAMNHNCAFSPDDSEIWTSMMMDSTSGMNMVVVYDGSMSNMMRQIRVGSIPTEITFSHDGAHAFVCNSGSGTVTMIDPTSKEVEAVIPVGHTPVGAWPGLDGKMYTDNEESKSISVIDPATATVVRTIELGFAPGYAATPNARDEVWVSDPDSARIHYFDRNSGAMLGMIDVGSGAHAIAFDGAGETAYVTNQFAGTVSVIRTSTHSVVATIPVGVKPNGIVVREP